MKFLKTRILICILLFITPNIFAQNINWNSIEARQKHIININIGLEHGLVYGISYGYKLKTKLPTVVDISYSFPSGEKLFDDFKTKFGAQVQVLKLNNFQFNAAIRGIYRRYENPGVSLQNFGSETSAQIGYFKNKWFLASDIGFDKAIVTHFKHSSVFKNDFPDVKNGWYEPATGGNFNYGITSGFSLKKNDINLKLGKIISEDFKTLPSLPFYVQLGINRRF